LGDLSLYILTHFRQGLNAKTFVISWNKIFILINKKFLEELIAYFHSILGGQQRKRKMTGEYRLTQTESDLISLLQKYYGRDKQTDRRVIS
jgi:hypothetical protein